jgi:hypothetical protein
MQIFSGAMVCFCNVGKSHNFMFILCFLFYVVNAQPNLTALVPRGGGSLSFAFNMIVLSAPLKGTLTYLGVSITSTTRVDLQQLSYTPFDPDAFSGFDQTHCTRTYDTFSFTLSNTVANFSLCVFDFPHPYVAISSSANAVQTETCIDLQMTDQNTATSQFRLFQTPTTLEFNTTTGSFGYISAISAPHVCYTRNATGIDIFAWRIGTSFAQSNWATIEFRPLYTEQKVFTILQNTTLDIIFETPTCLQQSVDAAFGSFVPEWIPLDCVLNTTFVPDPDVFSHVNGIVKNDIPYFIVVSDVLIHIHIEFVRRQGVFHSPDTVEIQDLSTIVPLEGFAYTDLNQDVSFIGLEITSSSFYPIRFNVTSDFFLQHQELGFFSCTILSPCSRIEVYGSPSTVNELLQNLQIIITNKPFTNRTLGMRTYELLELPETYFPAVDPPEKIIYLLKLPSTTPTTIPQESVNFWIITINIWGSIAAGILLCCWPFCLMAICIKMLLIGDKRGLPILCCCGVYRLCGNNNRYTIIPDQIPKKGRRQ